MTTLFSGSKRPARSPRAAPFRRLRMEPLERRALLAATWPGALLHDASGDLFTIDFDNAMALEHVGTTPFGMYDLAFSPEGNLFGITEGGFGATELYSIEVDFTDPAAGVTTEFLGTISLGVGGSVSLNALEFREDGELFAAGYDESFENNLFKIDPDTVGAEKVLSLDGYESAGDLAFDVDGNLFATTFSGDLLRMAPALDSYDVVANAGIYDFHGLIYGAEPVMVAFTQGREVYHVNPADGQATWVTTLAHPSLDLVQGAATVFPPPTDLGVVDFLALPGESTILGELWYRIVPEHTAVLTVDLPGVGLATDVDFNVYRLTAQGTLDWLHGEKDTPRMDYEDAQVGSEYYVQIENAAPTCDVRVTNLVHPLGNGAMVYGTTGNDTFVFAPGPPYTVMINGVNYPYNFNSGSEVTVTFHGGVGHDEARITGSAGTDLATLSLLDHSANVTSTSYYSLDVTGTPVIDFDGGGGALDRANLIGSAGPDSITLAPKTASVSGWAIDTHLGVTNVANLSVDGKGGNDSATFTGTPEVEFADLEAFGGNFFGSDFSTTLLRVEAITANANGGGDEATLAGTSGRDQFSAHPTWASLTGPGYSLRVNGFVEVEAQGNSADGDVARLYDRSGEEDFFTATPTSARLWGNGFSNEARAFRYVHAASSGGDDIARLFDDTSINRDKFVATPDFGVLYGATYLNRATNFRFLHATSQGGADSARVLDHAADTETFTATPEYGTLEDSTFLVQANGFSRLTGYSGGGGDSAQFFDDPATKETFHAAPADSWFSGADYVNRAIGFLNVVATSAGGADRAKLLDHPSGDDTFTGSPTVSTLSGSTSASYTHTVNHFHDVYAFSTGGIDIGSLHDSSGNDRLTASENRARIWWGGPKAQLADFSEVTAGATHGGNDLKRIDAIDFVLDEWGWIDF